MRFFYNYIAPNLYLIGIEVSHGSEVATTMMSNQRVTFERNCSFALGELVKEIDYTITDDGSLFGIEGIIMKTSQSVCDPLGISLNNYFSLQGHNLLYIGGSYGQVINQLSFAFESCAP